MTGKTTQTRVIKVVMDNKASAETKKISRDVATLNKNVKKTSKSMRSMNGIMGQAKSAFLGLAAAIGARELFRSADAFQLIKDRIRALWGEGTNAEAVFKQVAQVAQETNAPVETLADGFARISLSAKGMGLTVAQTARGVKSLQQTLRLSGASVAEVNSVYLQFSQAMGLSRLQGQELRAVMLGNAKLAQLLAEEFNTTRGALRDLGEKGLLDTARIFQMLIDKGGELDDQAKTLRVTFGQGMIKLFDALRVNIDKLNTAFSGSEGFNELVKIASKHMDIFLAAMSAIVTGGILYKIGAGIHFVGAAFLKWWGAATVATLMGPQGIVVGVVALTAAIAGLVVMMKLQEKAFSGDRTTEKFKKVEEARFKYEQAKRRTKLAQSRVENFNPDSGLSLDVLKKYLSLAERKEVKAGILYDKAKDASRKADVATKDKTKVVAGEFSKLNKEYDKAIGLTTTYINKLRDMELMAVEAQFEKGKISAVAYEEQLAKINKTYEDMLDKMETLANSGSVWHGIKRGAEDYVKSIGTVAEETAKVTTQAFGHLEDNLMEFIKKGKFEFRKFAQAIVDDVTRMVIRMSIVKPLANAIGSIGSNSDYKTEFDVQKADGGAFNRGKLLPFASGGIVGGPTTFGMSGGRTGLMGEAGPEAIMPLTRSSDGKLGVNASGTGTIVNVINQSGAETETKKSKNSNGQDQIDVYIKQKVTEGLNEGRYDKSMKSLYGLDRKGA